MKLDVGKWQGSVITQLHITQPRPDSLQDYSLSSILNTQIDSQQAQK